MTAENFDPKRYWEDRHEREQGLGAVGYLGLGAFNVWAYELRARVFQRMLRPKVGELRAARVLDVGSGTGFYLEQWGKLQPSALSAVDLALPACNRLREKFPSVNVRQLDVSAKWSSDFDALGTFDFISIMDVLYHIVDDDAYVRTFANLARLLNRNGTLVFTENFLHKKRLGNTWQTSRTEGEIAAVLKHAKLHIETKAPVFVLMNNPVNTESRAFKLYWRTLDRVLRRSNLAGHVLGASLLPVELALTTWIHDGPSTQIALAKKDV